MNTEKKWFTHIKLRVLLYKRATSSAPRMANQIFCLVSFGDSSVGLCRVTWIMWLYIWDPLEDASKLARAVSSPLMCRMDTGTPKAWRVNADFCLIPFMVWPLPLTDSRFRRMKSLNCARGWQSIVSHSWVSHT